jgi:hypothetical protein
LSVLALAAISDFQPAYVGGIAELSNDEPGEISLVVVQCRPCKGGYLFNLTDGTGGWANAFCPLGLCPIPLVNGSSVRLVVQRSESDPNFLYVQRLTIIAAPTGND